MKTTSTITSLVAITLLFCGSAVHSAEARPAAARAVPARPAPMPEDGFSAARLSLLDRVIAGHVARGEMAGAVVLVAHHGKVVHVKATGMADIDARRPMADDTIFRAYSMTKPVAAVAMMMLYERGLFQLDDPVAKYLPEFRDVRVLKTPQSPLTGTVSADRDGLG